MVRRWPSIHLGWFIYISYPSNRVLELGDSGAHRGALLIAIGSVACVVVHRISGPKRDAGLEANGPAARTDAESFLPARSLQTARGRKGFSRTDQDRGRRGGAPPTDPYAARFNVTMGRCRRPPR